MKLYSTAEAAEILGLTQSLVRRYCRDGRLPCIRVGRSWAITQEALDEFRDTPRPTGYPKGRPRK